MNGADVPATGLIAPGSRVSYRLLLAGEPKAIAAYQSFVEARANEAVELVSVRDARPALRVTLERGEQYLRLTALASLFLAGIAIAMAARRFATRHLDHCAILRTLGATQGFILRVYTLCLLWLGLLTSALGCLLGAGAQFVLARLLTGLVEGDLPAPSLCAARHRHDHRPHRAHRFWPAADRATPAHPARARVEARPR